MLCIERHKLHSWYDVSYTISSIIITVHSSRQCIAFTVIRCQRIEPITEYDCIITVMYAYCIMYTIWTSTYRARSTCTASCICICEYTVLCANPQESLLDMADVSLSNFGGDSMTSSSSTITSPAAGGSKIAVDLSMAYSPSAGKLAVRIVELRNLLSPSASVQRQLSSGSSGCVQLRMVLLPERKQRHKITIRYVHAVAVATTVISVIDTVVFNRLEPGMAGRQSSLYDLLDSGLFLFSFHLFSSLLFSSLLFSSLLFFFRFLLSYRCSLLSL